MLKRFLSLAAAVLAAGERSACADEAAIRKAAQAKFPRANVQTVTKLPFLGLYEVIISGEMVYSDENFDYIIYEGNIIDTKTDRNFTEERKRKLAMIPFEELPLDLAIKKVKGKGERKMAVFTDPDCPFCKRIEQDLAKVDNVTIYMFLYPIDSLHPKATERSKRIWCSPDKLKAWDDYMQKGVAPSAAPTCDNPVAKLVEFGTQARHQRYADVGIRQRRTRAGRDLCSADRKAIDRAGAEDQLSRAPRKKEQTALIRWRTSQRAARKLRLGITLTVSAALHVSLIYGIGVRSSPGPHFSPMVVHLPQPSLAVSQTAPAMPADRAASMPISSVEPQPIRAASLAAAVPQPTAVVPAENAEPASVPTSAAPEHPGEDNQLPKADVPLLVDSIWHEAKDLDRYPSMRSPVEPEYPQRYAIHYRRR